MRALKLHGYDLIYSQPVALRGFRYPNTVTAGLTARFAVMNSWIRERLEEILLRPRN